MREGREIARETKRFAAEHPWRSWFCLISTVAALGAAIVAACLPIAWPLRLAAAAVVSLLHVRTFVLFHDFQHGAILRGSRIAKLFFDAYGVLALTPPSMWRETHDEHHRVNQKDLVLDSVGTFPLLTVEDWRRATARERALYVISRHPFTMALGYITVFLWGFCVKPSLRSLRRHPDSLVASIVHAVLIVVLAWTRPDILLFALVLPLLISSALGSYLFYAQHNFPGARLYPGEAWDYVQAALRSSSYMPMNRLLRWFTANIGYHHVHHLNPRIPFYRLPEAMAAIEALRSPGVTRLRPAEILGCLRLKLWDSARERLVTFREARASSKPSAVGCAS